MKLKLLKVFFLPFSGYSFFFHILLIMILSVLLPLASGSFPGSSPASGLCILSWILSVYSLGFIPSC